MIWQAPKAQKTHKSPKKCQFLSKKQKPPKLFVLNFVIAFHCILWLYFMPCHNLLKSHPKKKNYKPPNKTYTLSSQAKVGILSNLPFKQAFLGIFTYFYQKSSKTPYLLWQKLFIICFGHATHFIYIATHIGYTKLQLHEVEVIATWSYNCIKLAPITLHSLCCWFIVVIDL